MPSDDDEGPDPDYGIWGDAGLPPLPPPAWSPEDAFRAVEQRRRREASERTSREFNSHMIYLFNRP